VTNSRPLAALGSPARVTVTKVVRTSWRIEWEYDGCSSFWEEASHSMEATPVRRRRVRHMQGRGVAYRAAAMRYIFVRRDRYAKEVVDGKRAGCTLCDAAPIRHWNGEAPDLCKYHDDESVERLRARLAQRLLWRDFGVAK
jgi:hypothetical protein